MPGSRFTLPRTVGAMATDEIHERIREEKMEAGTVEEPTTESRWGGGAPERIGEQREEKAKP